MEAEWDATFKNYTWTLFDFKNERIDTIFNDIAAKWPCVCSGVTHHRLTYYFPKPIAYDLQVTLTGPLFLNVVGGVPTVIWIG